MQLQQTETGCQLPNLRQLAEATLAPPPQPLSKRLKLALRRQLSPGTERTIKRTTNNLANRLRRLMGREARPTNPSAGSSEHLRAGDMVRVRSQAEIEGTLDNWRQVRGCTFMPEMLQYCGTVQRVLKPMQRFVDERDLRVKRSSGIVLLEGVLCQGTADFGRCDRACHLFWREEWLEKID